MKVEINIDPSNFGGTIEQVFQSLTEEDKKELAKEVLSKYLLEDYKAERLAKAQEIIRNLRERGDSSWSNNSDKYKNMTDEEVIGTYEYKQRENQIKTSKEEMILTITTAAITHYKELVNDLIKNDTQLTEIYEKVKTVIEDNYAEYVKQTMMSVMTNLFSDTFKSSMENKYNLINMHNEIDQIKQNLYQR